MAIDTATTRIIPEPPAAANRILLDHHRRELEVGSGISPEVIARRGYFSAETTEQLQALGFAPYQALPGLVAPRYNLAGRLDGYLLKPDNPRVDAKTGKPIKYENPAGTFPDLDILPEDLPRLKHTDEEIWYFEGHKKSDASRSRGKLPISVTGTHMYLNGRVIVPSLDEIPLDGRRVVICYDSDVGVKDGVANAEYRLAAACKRRGAKVETIRLPAGPNGEKQGFDDALVAGMSLAEIEALRRPWDGTGPGIRIHDPYAGADKDAMIAEQALVISLLCGLIRNPHLRNSEKIVALQAATLCRDKAADGAVEPSGHVRLSPAEIAENYLRKPEPGSPTPAVDRFGNKPLMSRKSVGPAIDHAIERGLINATPIKTERSHRSGATYEATSWLMTPPASLSAALRPWSNWCPEEPKLRKPRTLREPCSHCGGVHPIQRTDVCVGCGAFTKRVINPDPPEGYVDSSGEIISPEENVPLTPSPPTQPTYWEKLFPRTPEEPAWLADAPAPAFDDDLYDVQLDIETAAHAPDAATARPALRRIETALAGAAIARGRQPVPKPPPAPRPAPPVMDGDSQEVWL